MNKLLVSDNEHVALKAASDVLDRNPATSRTLKAQITSFSLDRDDARALAEVLAQGREVSTQFSELSKSDFITIEDPLNGKEEQEVEVRRRGEGRSPRDHEVLREGQGNDKLSEARKEPAEARNERDEQAGSSTETS